MRDVVIVGAGHNALTAACYLARDGLDVEVVERDTVLGGAVSTVARWPGYLVDRGSSAHLMVRHTGIIEELGLASVGLRYVDLDPWAFAPLPGTAGITFYRSLARTCDSIAAACGQADAAAYAGFVTEWLPRARRLSAGFSCAPSRRSAVRFFGGLGRGGDSGGELARVFLQSAESLVLERFASEPLRAALCWLAAQSGPPPWEPGTAPILGWHTLLHELPASRAIGGSGALSAALAKRLEGYAGKLRLGDGVTEITMADGRATGVRTASGEHIAARTVLAGCHVATTLALLGDSLPPTLRDRVAALRTGNGIGMVVRLATTGLPHYPGAAAESADALQLLVSSRAQLRAAHAAYSCGRPPERPATLAMSFSGLDPSIAPPGRHTVSIWGQWHPFDLADGASWDDIGAREGARLIEALDAAAPGFAGMVEHVHVQTPLSLERELGLLRGNIMHVDMGLDSLFALRPLPELAGHRTPVPGLYLTGASTHPGGGVSGASGRSAARIVAADLGRRGASGTVVATPVAALRRAGAAALGLRLR